jgi:hypothetical protein
VKQESKDTLLDLIEKSNIEIQDKLELYINMYYILQDYEENIKILSEHKKKVLRRRYDNTNRR